MALHFECCATACSVRSTVFRPGTGNILPSETFCYMMCEEDVGLPGNVSAKLSVTVRDLGGPTRVRAGSSGQATTTPEAENCDLENQLWSNSITRRQDAR